MPWCRESEQELAHHGYAREHFSLPSILSTPRTGDKSRFLGAGKIPCQGRSTVRDSPPRSGRLLPGRCASVKHVGQIRANAALTLNPFRRGDDLMMPPKGMTDPRLSMAGRLAVVAVHLAWQVSAVIGAGTFDVREYGAVGDGKTLDTAAISKVVEACAQAGGGQVRFAPGRSERKVSGTFLPNMRITPSQKRAYFHSLPWLPIARGYHAGGPKAVNSPSPACLGRAFPRMVCTGPPTRLGTPEDIYEQAVVKTVAGFFRGNSTHLFGVTRFGAPGSYVRGRLQSP